MLLSRESRKEVRFQKIVHTLVYKTQADEIRYVEAATNKLKHTIGSTTKDAENEARDTAKKTSRKVSDVADEAAKKAAEKEEEFTGKA